MSDRLARALAGVPAYAQPYRGLHNKPYSQMTLPPFEQPGTFSAQYLPPMGAPQPQQSLPQMPPSAPPQIAQSAPPMMGFDPNPPVSMEMQGMPAPQPVGQNQLERDYYAQLAQNPNGFDKGWLGRLLG